MTTPTTLDERIGVLVLEVDQRLRTELQQLFRMLRDVGYPEGVLDIMMCLGLRLTALLYDAIGCMPSSDNLFSSVEELNKRKILPDEMASYLHLIRVLSNKPHHDAEQVRLPTIYSTETAMPVTLTQMLENLLEVTAGEGGREAQLEAELERLRAQQAAADRRRREMVRERIVGPAPRPRLRARRYGQDRSHHQIAPLICRTLEPDAAAELRAKWQEQTSLADKLEFLFRRTLGTRRYPIVLDEENHIRDEFSDLRQFVEKCLEYDHGARLIATSRPTRVLPPEVEGRVGGRRVELPLDEGLPEDEAVALLRELDADGRLGMKEAPDATLRDVARRCHGIPQRGRLRTVELGLSGFGAPRYRRGPEGD